MPGFVQIMEFTTSRIDEVDALEEKMLAERGTALLATPQSSPAATPRRPSPPPGTGRSAS